MEIMILEICLVLSIVFYTICFFFANKTIAKRSRCKKRDVTDKIRRLNPTRSPILEMVDTTNINRDMTRGGMVEPLFPFVEESEPVSKDTWDLLEPKRRNMTYEEFKKGFEL